MNGHPRSAPSLNSEPDEPVRLADALRVVARLLEGKAPACLWLIALGVASEASAMWWISIVADTSASLTKGFSLGSLMLVACVGIGSMITALLSRVSASRLTVNLTLSIQARLHEQFLRLGAAFHERHSRGELVRTALQGVSASSSFAVQMATGSIVGLGSAIFGARLLWRQLARAESPTVLAIVLGATVIGLPLATDAMSRRLQTAFTGVRKAQTQVTEQLTQSLLDPIGLMLGNATRVRASAFEKILSELAPVQVRASGLASLANELPRVASLTIQLLVLALVVLSGASSDKAVLVTSALAAMMIAPQVASNISNLTGIISASRQMWPEVQRVAAVLEETPAIPEPTGSEPTRLPEGTAIEFENVVFRYEKSRTPVIRGISLTIPAGSTTAIVGGSGSGKSTLLRLLGRVHDVTEGRIRMAGIDVRALPWSALRSFESVARCAQEPVFMPISIRENFRTFLPDVTDERIEAACREVDVWDALVNASADDPLALRVANTQAEGALSGGQRKRLELARAMCGTPRVLVLDEPTSGISVADKSALIPAFLAAKVDKTCLLIDHDLEFVAAVADRIAVLDGGVLVEEGTVESLMSNPDSTLRKLMASDFKSRPRSMSSVEAGTPPPAERVVRRLGEPV